MSSRASLLALSATAIARVKNDQLLRATTVLVGGTASAQALALLALPLLTRIYSAQDFSVLAVFVAVLTLLAAVTCMRLDTAIPLPEKEQEAVNLFVLSLASAAAVTAVLVLGVLLVGERLAAAAGRPELTPYLWLVPAGAALAGVYSIFQYMAMRQKAFGLIARTRITQATAGLGTQLALGFAGLAPLGLLIGHALMAGAGSMFLAFNGFRSMPKVELSLGGLRETLYNYRKFPQYSVAEELINNAGIQIPVLLIATFLVGPEAGFLFLAMRVVDAPLTVIGSAVSQVYYSHAAQYHREGRLAEETVRVFRRLGTWLVLPMVALGPFAPGVFRIVFGQEWERAGVLLVWMLPWFVFRLIASPISMVIYVRNLQRLLLVLSISGFVIRTAPIGIALVLAAQYSSLIYSVSSAVYYLILLVALLVAGGVKFWSSISLVSKSIALWTGVGVGSYFIYVAVCWLVDTIKASH